MYENWDYTSGVLSLDIFIDYLLNIIKSNFSIFTNIALSFLAVFTLINILMKLIENYLQGLEFEFLEIIKQLVKFSILYGIISIWFTNRGDFNTGILKMVYDTFANLGAKIGGLTQTPSLDGILVFSFEKINVVLKSMSNTMNIKYYTTHPKAIVELNSIIPRHIFLLSSIVVILVLAVQMTFQIFVLTIEYYLLGSMSVIYLVGIVFKQTAFLGDKVLQIIISLGMKIAVTFSVFGMCYEILEGQVNKIGNLENGFNIIEQFTFIGTMIVLTYIIKEIPNIALSMLDGNYNTAFSRGSAGAFITDGIKKTAEISGKVIGAVFAGIASGGNIEAMRQGYELGGKAGIQAGETISKPIDLVMSDEGTDAFKMENNKYLKNFGNELQEAFEKKDSENDSKSKNPGKTVENFKDTTKIL